MRITKRLRINVPGTDIEVSAKTFAEMNAGQLANKRYEMIMKVDNKIVMLTKRFETLWLSTTLPPPYDHVKVEVSKRDVKQGPVETFMESVDDFPSDFMIAKLMLMS